MRSVLRIAAVFVFALAASGVLAAPPKITRLSVRGLQTGGTTRIAIQGTDLLPEPKLLVEFPIAEQKLVGTPRANSLEFDVTLDASVPAGVYHLRLATTGGLTPPEIIAVDHLPQHAAGPSIPSMAAEKLPLAIHGQIAGAAVQETRFEGKQGQAVTVDVLAQRFGSKLRPVVTLADSAGRQLAAGLPVSHLLGDARFNVTLPADGVYTLAVHDLAYAGATPGHYRLSIGQFDYVDHVYPPVVQEYIPHVGDRSTEIELVGHFGNAAVAVANFDPAGIGVRDSDGDWGALFTRGIAPICEPIPWPAGSQPIGLRPRVELGFGLVEDRTLDASRRLRSADVSSKVSRHAVSGRLLKAGEEDAYHLIVKPGEKWRFEVLGTQIGSPIDASLELRGAKGARLAQNDDAPGADARTTVPDPQLEYTVAAGVNEVAAVVTDAYRRGGPEMIYRLTATRLDGPGAPGSDFALRIFEDTHLVPAAGSKVFRVEADRKGYEGPISLGIYSLPTGFTAEPARIRIGATAALVEIRRSKETSPAQTSSGQTSTGRPPQVALRTIDTSPAEPQFAVGASWVVGEMVWHPMLRHKAVVATAPLRTLQPWLADNVAIAPATFAHEFGVDWEIAAAPDVVAAVAGRPVSGNGESGRPATAAAPSGAHDTGLEEKALLGKDRKFTVRFRRGPGAIGPIRLSLMTSQVPVLVNGQPNAMQVLRGPTATVDVPLDPAVKQAFDAQAAAEKALATLEAVPAPKPAKPGDTVKPDPKRDADLKATRAKLDEAAKKLREAEAKLKPTFEYTLSVPADLATIPYDVCIKAELRSLDNQTTLVEAFTPIKHLSISAPVELVVSKEPIAVAFDPKTGATATVTGLIRRLEDFAGDVTLSIAGLPAAVPAPREVLKAKADKFQLAIKVPAAFQGKSLEGLRVTASVVPDAKRATVTATVEAKLPAINLTPPTQVAVAAPVAKPAPTPAAKPTETKPAKPAEAKIAATETKPAVAKPADKKPATKVAAPKK